MSREDGEELEMGKVRSLWMKHEMDERFERVGLSQVQFARPSV